MSRGGGRVEGRGELPRLWGGGGEGELLRLGGPGSDKTDTTRLPEVILTGSEWPWRKVVNFLLLVKFPVSGNQRAADGQDGQGQGWREPWRNIQ